MKEGHFCIWCGKKLIEKEYFTGEYNVYSGEKIIKTLYTCPNKKWYNVHTKTDDLED